MNTITDRKLLVWEIGNRLLELDKLDSDSIKKFEEETIHPFFKAYGKAIAEKQREKMVEYLSNNNLSFLKLDDIRNIPEPEL